MSVNQSILSASYFHDEQAAYEFVEMKLWPNGPVCPKCGSIGQHYKLSGKSTRIGVRKCRDCRKPFRITVGTVFESSHIPLRVQSDQFIKAAQELGLDEGSGDAFERAMDSLTKAKKSKSS
jgi:transposase-like protein